MAYQRIYDSTWGRRTPFFYPPEPPGTLIVSDGVGGVQSVANQQPALDSRLTTLEGANLDPRVTALENAGFISSPFNPAPLVLQPDPVFPGRVGLNRSDPGFSLDIQNLPGDQTTTIRVRNNRPGASVNLDLRSINAPSNERAVIGTQTNHPLDFKTNNTKCMRLTDAGDLEVDNNATVEGTLTVQGTSAVGTPNTVDGTAGPLISITRRCFEFDPFIRPNTAGYEFITMNHNIADISKIRNISGTALITSTIGGNPVLSAHPLLHFDSGVDVYIADVTATEITAGIWRELSAGTAQTVLVRAVIDLEV